MLLETNAENLREILELFYNLSGINEIIAYPYERCPFCSEIHSESFLAKKCDECDLHSFEESRKANKVIIYKCHAGLIEATVPLSHNGNIIGYVMFGQITDIKDKNELNAFVLEINKKYNLKCTSKGLKYRSKKQLSAAVKLLEICTEYILLKDLVAPRFSKTTLLAREYIASNLGSEINISDICRYANVSRTKLYDSFRRECSVGIASYIRKSRLDYAKKLLKNTSMTVSEVSESAGFSDYNYFSRIFKKEFGTSPHKIKR